MVAQNLSTGDWLPGEGVPYLDLEPSFHTRPAGRAITRSGPCGPDTVLYPFFKGEPGDTLQPFGLSFTGSNYSLAGQRYRGYAGLEVHGVEMLARSNVPGTAVNVSLEVWSAGPDSLPDTLIHAESVSIGFSPLVWAHTFTAPVAVEGDYFIMLENRSSDFLALYSNDFNRDRGAGENLAVAGRSDSSGYRFFPLLSAYTFPTDADWLLFPVVTYPFEGDFGFDPECLVPGEEVSLFDRSTPILADPMYNQQAFRLAFDSLADSTFFYDFGDGNGVYAGSQAVSHTFAASNSSYTVTQRTALEGWTQVCRDTTMRRYRTGARPGFEPTLIDDSVTVAAATQGKVDSVRYDFGDGSGPTADTTHRYQQVGTYVIVQTVYGCGGPATARDTVVVSVASLQGLQSSVGLGPNPSEGLFTLTLPGHHPWRLSVTNQLGQTVWQGQGRGTVPIDLGAQPPGVYWLKGQGGGAAFSRKLMVR